VKPFVPVFLTLALSPVAMGIPLFNFTLLLSAYLCLRGIQKCREEAVTVIFLADTTGSFIAPVLVL
jgi:hypothetical protein